MQPLGVQTSQVRCFELGQKFFELRYPILSGFTKILPKTLRCVLRFCMNYPNYEDLTNLMQFGSTIHIFSGIKNRVTRGLAVLYS